AKTPCRRKNIAQRFSALFLKKGTIKHASTSLLEITLDIGALWLLHLRCLYMKEAISTFVWLKIMAESVRLALTLAKLLITQAIIVRLSETFLNLVNLSRYPIVPWLMMIPTSIKSCM